MHLLRGVVQHYDWGDQQFIPEFLSTEADARPWAELWFGTHRGGPSLVKNATGSQPLEQLTGDLSFLVKIIAANGIDHCGPAFFLKRLARCCKHTAIENLACAKLLR